jgi:hypothetical protein
MSQTADHSWDAPDGKGGLVGSHLPYYLNSLRYPGCLLEFITVLTSMTTEAVGMIPVMHLAECCESATIRTSCYLCPSTALIVRGMHNTANVTFTPILHQYLWNRAGA